MRTKTIKSLIMTLLMAVLIIVGMAAISQTEAYADGEYDGSVFISLSDDGKFVVSDGEISDVPLAHLEVPLQDIAEINLADWDLEFYSRTGSRRTYRAETVPVHVAALLRQCGRWSTSQSKWCTAFIFHGALLGA